MEAMRALKRRLSDVVYRQLVNDHKQQNVGGDQETEARGTGPEGHLGTTTKSSAAGSEPQRRPFGQVTFRARHHRRYPDPRLQPRPSIDAPRRH